MVDFCGTWPFEPAGDQPKAITQLFEGIQHNVQNQLFIGVTGSGKTHTMARVIEKCKRPALVIAHNKVLAAQLFQEFKEFFPKNSVQYFISYYDYFRPEAYIPNTNTFIEKTSSINADLDRMRHKATRSIWERNDTIVVSSVSCLYGIGTPENYIHLRVHIQMGDALSRQEFLQKLVAIQYTARTPNIDNWRGTFKASGNTVDVIPSDETDLSIRVCFLGKKIVSLEQMDALTGEHTHDLSDVWFYPVSHHIIDPRETTRILEHIRQDLHIESEAFKQKGEEAYATRLLQRTLHDIALMEEIGHCKGIENYSRYLEGRQKGEPPATFLDYLPTHALIFIDESHMTIPQMKAMWKGDRSRKSTLVRYGFRMSCALDNRPLTFHEFMEKSGQKIYVSATPGSFESHQCTHTIPQIVRPTHLLDPILSLQPAHNQVFLLIEKLKNNPNSMTLVSVLTKKMAEHLSSHLSAHGIPSRYLHSDIEPLQRMDIIRAFRMGHFQALIGIQLLKEGLDLPEVECVAILDADKKGFLRNTNSLIQLIGRAARNKNGHAVLYANTLTKDMQACIDETNKRRHIQSDYNQKHGVQPLGTTRKIHQPLILEPEHTHVTQNAHAAERRIQELTTHMRNCAGQLQFEEAAKIRDKIRAIRDNLKR